MSTTSPDDPPSDAMIQLLSPDGYYKYLNIPKPSATGIGEVDEDMIKKNYRKLSLKHHPDKKGGDAETFRVLKRAQTVLSNAKLRQQYDILGLDLDDDEEHRQDGDDDPKADPSNPAPTTSQGIVHEIAGMALTAVLQMGVRTLMMCVVSVLVVKYRWTLFPALGFLAFIAYRIHVVAVSALDYLSPFCIGAGLLIMHTTTGSSGWFGFWVGESLVIGMFTYNSMAGTQLTPPLLLAMGGFSMLAALWFRGKFWNYAIVLALEAFLAIFIAMAFPIMEMVLETVLNDKLKKVGDKVRAHHEHLKRYYESKQ